MMDKIVNLTQHIATPDQITAGVVEPTDKSLVQALLTFESLPDNLPFLSNRANALAAIAAKSNCLSAMIGGAPYLMPHLEESLRSYGITPLYAFSVRLSVEEVVDGKVVKKAIFVHAGFVQGMVKSMRTYCTLGPGTGKKCDYWKKGECIGSKSNIDDAGLCSILDQTEAE